MKVALDDMILTKSLPTSAGSKMLDGFMSLFDAEVVTRLETAGHAVCGKVNVGEMGIDVIGETSYFDTACAAAAMANGDCDAAVQVDVNGAPRRAAAQNGQVFVKPTYGTVSRFGAIAAACSGDTVGVGAKTVAAAKEVLTAIVGHDDKDGTSQPQDKCDLLKADAPRNAVKKVALVKGFADNTVLAVADVLKAKGVEVAEVDAPALSVAGTAWNVLMSAELCNNVSRYDGVKYGYRSKNYTSIDELYTNSRTESFGELLKAAILLGSDVLSTDNYDKMYDKALRVRRVVVEAFAKLFADADCVLMPTVSKMQYTAEDFADKYFAFKENRYTAPASITGLPTVVVGGVQLIGPAFSDMALLDVAESVEEAVK